MSCVIIVASVHRSLVRAQPAFEHHSGSASALHRPATLSKFRLRVPTSSRALLVAPSGADPHPARAHQQPRGHPARCRPVRSAMRSIALLTRDLTPIARGPGPALHRLTWRFRCRPAPASRCSASGMTFLLAPSDAHKHPARVSVRFSCLVLSSRAMALRTGRLPPTALPTCRQAAGACGARLQMPTSIRRGQAALSRRWPDR